MFINRYFPKILIIILLIYNLNAHQESNIQNTKKQILKIDNKENSLRILSWNVKMFGGFLGCFYEDITRFKKIIIALNNLSIYDIILFQEAFSKDFRDNIYNSLKDNYPYQIESNDNTHNYKNNSGLWVISSIPIILIDKINFTKLAHTDQLSSKGAHLYSIIKNHQEFYIINTHMQAGIKKKYSDIRIDQYKEINRKLILPNEDFNIPIILCGDLNISKRIQLNQMLEKLDFINGPILGKEQYSLINNPKLLDYILVKTKEFKFKSVERRIQNISDNLINTTIQLSDHHAIEGLFKW